MERPRLSSVNTSGLANPSSNSPHQGVEQESTAASGVQEKATPVASATSELQSRERGSPAVTVTPANPQRHETAGPNEPTSPSRQQLKPVLRPPTAQSMPERTTSFAVAARPATAQTLTERPSSPTHPHQTIRTMSVGNHGSSSEKLEDADTLSGVGFPELHRDSALRTDQPLPPPPQARVIDNGGMPTHRQRGLHHGPGSTLGRGSVSRRSYIDYMVPYYEKEPLPGTVAARIWPTLKVAREKRAKYAAKAKASGWTLNTAIGLQVLFGSITTGLSALGTTGRSTAVQTTIFGALSTLVASYLARARGSKEPELSLIRVRDLEHFEREVEAFSDDYGHVDTDRYDGHIHRYRQRLEDILDGSTKPTSSV